MGTETTLERIPLVPSPASVEVLLFLTNAELQVLTGYRSYAKQIQWLIVRGWVHEVSAIGRPVVARLYCQNRLGFIGDSEKSWSPDLSVFRGG